MAKRDAAGAPKSWSSKLDKLSFMRRASHKTKLVDEAKERAFKNEEDHWTVQPSHGTGGCIVIVEGDPPHSAPTSRMSFQNFNPATEKLQRELEGQNQKLQYIRELGEQCRRDKISGAEISAEEMAKRLKTVDLVLQPEVKDEELECKDRIGPGRLSGSGRQPGTSTRQGVPDGVSTGRDSVPHRSSDGGFAQRRWQGSQHKRTKRNDVWRPPGR